MNQRVILALAVATLVYGASSAVSTWTTHPGTSLSSGSALLGLLGSGLACAGVMTWLAVQSRLRGTATMLRLFAIGAIIDGSNLIEAAVFDVVPMTALGTFVAIAVATHGLAITSIVRILGSSVSLASGPSSAFQGATVWWWISRVAAIGLLYAITYFIAGAIIYPFVRDFYEAKPLPPPGTVFGLQAFIRGPAFAVIGAIVVSLIAGARGKNAFAVGATLCGLGGLCALLHPNPLFPTAVRFVHLAEVGTSNLVFGMLAGLILTRGLRNPRSAVATQSA